MVKAGSKTAPRRGRLDSARRRPDPAVGVLRGRSGRLAGAFIAPALAIYLLIIVAPAIGTLWISFTKWKGIGDEAKWVGADNYQQLWRNDVFRDSFERTLLVLVAGGIAVFVCGFVFAMLLREMRAKRFIRAVIFFPNVVPPVALAIAWGVLLAPRNGLLNGSLDAVGLSALTQDVAGARPHVHVDQWWAWYGSTPACSPPS